MGIQIQMCFIPLNPNPQFVLTQDIRKWYWIGLISFSAFCPCVSWCLKIHFHKHDRASWNYVTIDHSCWEENSRASWNYVTIDHSCWEENSISISWNIFHTVALNVFSPRMNSHINLVGYVMFVKQSLRHAGLNREDSWVFFKTVHLQC